MIEIYILIPKHKHKHIILLYIIEFKIIYKRCSRFIILYICEAKWKLDTPNILDWVRIIMDRDICGNIWNQKNYVKPHNFNSKYLFNSTKLKEVHTF